MAPGTVSVVPGMESLSLAPAIRVRLAQQMVGDSTSAGNNINHEPGTGDGKPSTRDCAVQCTCVHVRLLNKFTLVIDMKKLTVPGRTWGQATCPIKSLFPLRQNNYSAPPSPHI